MVEYASTFLMSRCTNASTAPMMMVIPPMIAMKFMPPAPIEKPLKNTGYMRAARNTPATTMVAAWISAETGVGPAMASGSHVCSGNWPLLPITPTNRQAAPARSSAWSAPLLNA